MKKKVSIIILLLCLFIALLFILSNYRFMTSRPETFKELNALLPKTDFKRIPLQAPSGVAIDAYNTVYDTTWSYSNVNINDNFYVWTTSVENLNSPFTKEELESTKEDLHWSEGDVSFSAKYNESTGFHILSNISNTPYYGKIAIGMSYDEVVDTIGIGGEAYRYSDNYCVIYTNNNDPFVVSTYFDNKGILKQIDVDYTMASTIDYSYDHANEYLNYPAVEQGGN